VIGKRLGVFVPSKGACATYADRNDWKNGGSDSAPEARQSKPAKPQRVKKPTETCSER
jgi:hypothetical protein